MDIFFNGDWTQPTARMTFIVLLFAPVLILVGAMLVGERRGGPRVARFWCRDANRDVEVTFEAGTVKTCTAFATGHAIDCRRACVDAAFRAPRSLLMLDHRAPRSTAA